MTEADDQARLRTERLAELGSVFAGFAHEIRNPLSTIGLNLQLVLEEYEDAESSRERRTAKRLDVVQGEVKRLEAILEEFLGFVRRPAPRRAATDLNRLLQALVDLSTPELAQKGVALKFFPGPSVGTLPVDADQLRAAVVNLLRNAKDACSAGDEVLVSARRRPDGVVIQVTDTGPGMPPEIVDKAFRPYFSTKQGGTGLGLAMVQRTVTEHGGHLELSSEPGKGTQFSLYLPLEGVAAPAPSSAEEGA